MDVFPEPSEKHGKEGQQGVEAGLDCKAPSYGKAREKSRAPKSLEEAVVNPPVGTEDSLESGPECKERKCGPVGWENAQRTSPGVAQGFRALCSVEMSHGVRPVEEKGVPFEHNCLFPRAQHGPMDDLLPGSAMK